MPHTFCVCISLAATIIALSSKEVPSSWLYSEVVMIVKNYQEDTRSLSNYRPISLTNISYKIFASMVQSRLSRCLDNRIRPTQFGFHKSRSTTQPIHILGRLLEVHGRQPSPLHVLFLDWSKAFDSVTFTAIMSAMQFIGVSTHVIDVVMPLCHAPSFVVRDSHRLPLRKSKPKGSVRGAHCLHTCLVCYSLISSVMLRPSITTTLG